MTLLLVGIFLTELVKYGIWFRGIQGLQFRRLWLGGILAGIYLVLILVGVVNEDTALLAWNFISVIVYAILIECAKNERYLFVLQALFIVTGMDEIVGGIIKLARGLPIQNAILNKENGVQSNVVIIILFGIIAKIISKKKISDIKITKMYDKLIGLIIGIMGVSLFLVITGFQSIAQYYIGDKIRFFSRIITIVSFVCVGCLALIIGYIFNEIKRYKLFIEKDELLLKMQKNEYDTMVAKNQKIRSFQHDIKNHFMCLYELAQNEEINKIQEYIKNIENDLYYIEKRVFFVGNSVIDAVLNYYASLLDDDIDISIVGKCASEVKINDVELCTIISNLVQNATEALKLAKDVERYLKIEFWVEKNYMGMKIKNSYSGEKIVMDDKNNIPKTSKNNREEHGIGIKNVKETVEKNSGIFDMNINDKEFTVSIILPVQIK